MTKTKTYRPPVYHAHEKTRTGYLIVALLAIGALAFVAMVVFAGKADASTGQALAGDTGDAGILGPVLVTGLAVAFVKKIVDFPAYVKGKDWDSVTKTSLAWAAGIVVAFLLQATDFAKDFQLAGVVLADTNPATVVFFGLSIASTASFGTDWLASRDNTRTSAVPPLVGPPNGNDAVG